MSYLKPVVVASTMLVASLSAPVFANHMNYAATPQLQASTNLTALANRNSPISNVSCFNWEKRIFVGGLLNVDAVYSGRDWNASVAPGFRVPSFFSDSAHGSDIVVNNANLLVDAKVNDATKAHIGLAFTQRPGQSSFISDRDDSQKAQLDIDEAYITFNDCSSPFYLQAGRKFTSFGNYNPYPITYSLTQLLSQTDEEVLEFGYNSNDGLHGAVYVFNGPLSGLVNGNADVTRINNYGVDIAYSAQYDNISYNIGADYVKDIRDATFVAGQLSGSNSRGAAGYALHGDLSNGPFSLSGDYVTAGRQILVSGIVDSRAWAYGLQLGYGFDSMGYASNASVGYQHSGDSLFLPIPRSRVLADYTIEVSKNAKVTLEYTHSQDHKPSLPLFGLATTMLCHENGTNNTTNTATVRIGVAI